MLSIIRRIFIQPASFVDSETEAKFLREYCNLCAPHRRAASIMAVFTWSIYALWDWFYAKTSSTFSDIYNEVSFVRATGVLVISIMAWLMFRKSGQSNEIYSTAVLGFCSILTYTLVLAFSYIVPWPYKYNYLPGSFVVLLFIFCFLRLRSGTTLVIGVLCLLYSIIYLALEIRSGLTASIGDYNYYISVSLFYIATFIVIGYAVAVELERSAREAYRREGELAALNLALEDKNSELLDLNKSLEFSRIETENRTHALIALKEKSRELAEQQNRDKSVFIAEAAHDLKQPMQAIGDFLDGSSILLQRGDYLKSQELIDAAIDATRIMRASFNAVLDISRLESGFVEANYSNFDLVGLVDEVISQQDPFASNSDVRLLKVKRPKGVIPIYSDRVLLGRVLSNLVSNGVKYSDQNKLNPVVAVGITCFPQYIRLSILDNGIGIPATELQNVFKPFHQIDNPERDRRKGLGLGLAIVNSIMTLLYEHRISVRSFPGNGTRFTLQLPCATGLNIDYQYDILTVPQYGTLALDGLYVLLVENDVLLRRSMTAMLRANGALCEVADSLENLLDILPTIERDPDVVISDYRLPNQHTALDIIRAVHSQLGIEMPILIVTGEVSNLDAEPEFCNRTILRKPVEPALLINTIRHSCFRETAAAV